MQLFLLTVVKIFAVKGIGVRKVQAVSENTWVSPVQPIRSSLWGQSVGKSTKLLFMPQAQLESSRFSFSLPVVRTDSMGISE